MMRWVILEAEAYLENFDKTLKNCRDRGVIIEKNSALVNKIEFCKEISFCI